MAKETIVPPNDPFLVFRELKSSQVWPLICDYCKSGMITVSQTSAEESALIQILALVRNAYRLPGGESDTYGLKGSDYERLHRQFLRHKCHWDSARQDYVRA